jgi:DNA-directed RNA polymerase subunit RPC12/RpoP
MQDSIRFTCTSCGKNLKSSQTMAGKMGKCPTCGKQFTVPEVHIELDDDFDDLQLAPPDTKYCHQCGQLISRLAELCTGCGVRQSNGTHARTYGVQEEGGKGLIIAGYACGLLALGIFPPGLGVAGTVIGVVNLTKGRAAHGISQIVIAVTCGTIGMILGAAVMSR